MPFYRQSRRLLLLSFLVLAVDDAMAALVAPRADQPVPADAVISVPIGDIGPDADWTDLLTRTFPATADVPEWVQAILDALKAGSLDQAQALIDTALASHRDEGMALELRGVLNARRGDLQASLADFERSVAASPGRGSPLTKLATVQMAMGQRDRASVNLRRALALDPHDRFAHQRLGLLLQERGDTAAAIEQFEAGIAGTPPAYVGVKANLAALYLARGDAEKARDLLRPLAGAPSMTPTALRVLASAELATGGAETAARLFERATEQTPDDAGAWLGLGMARRAAGDPAAALGALERAGTLGAEPFAVNYQRGEALAALERWSQAQEAFAAAGRADARWRSLASRREADMLAAAGKTDQAAAAYRALLDAGDAGPEVYAALSALFQKQGRWDAALDILQELVRAHPDDPQAQLRVGTLLASRTRYAEALEHLDRGLALAPDDPGLLKAASLARYRLGDLGQAIDAAERLLRQVPDDVNEMFYLATLYEANRDGRAEALYQQVLARDADHVPSMNNLALLVAARGDVDEALALSRRAAELAPDSAIVIDTLGVTLLAAEQPREARRAFEHALSLDPDYADARRHLESLGPP